MTIPPLHSDINLEVFYVNICGFILQYALCDYMIEDSKRAAELHREHMLCTCSVHPFQNRPDIRNANFEKTNFALSRDLVTHGCAETPLLLLLVSIYTWKLGIQTAF